MSLSIADIVTLFQRRGHEQYDGEPVTQLQHALQTASFAEAAGAGSELITACLLHDIGHLLHEFGPTPTSQGKDDVHQYRCLPFLRPLFGAATLDAIKLHVDAKRYLCVEETGYFDTLSPDSRRSLVLQGGIFTAEQAARFAALPHAAAAISLRRWDDRAKIADGRTPGLPHFVPYMEDAAQRHAMAVRSCVISTL
ncbi:phosphonate degradation HD-domain oxygenase [Undibacterium sp.]|uniref:phosphonate degradation HD-domain oxygenase n=1 Tax=Undibacterium sp. TaxID=1914977 RepID=UPI002BAF54E8|nr:phosphonate degradation HD-domain oxygenase [Undibacterium sp.]HTD06743.1 HD domain-containing protein [Undibacterium sp.]